MRKLLIAAVTALVAASGFAVIAHAGDGVDGTSWNFKFTTTKKSSATGTDSLVKPSKLKSNGEYVLATKNVVFFPKGTKFDKTVKPSLERLRCSTRPEPGPDCRKALVGDGRAVLVVGNSASAPGTKLAATLIAYNTKKGFMFVIQPCGVGTGPGTGAPCSKFGSAIVLPATLGYADRKKTQPKLTVVTPKQLVTGNVVIDTFQLVTKRFKKGKGERARYYTKTPAICKGGWPSKLVTSYKDGSKQTIKDRAPCKK